VARKDTRQNFNFSELVEPCFVSHIWSILERVPCADEKSVCSVTGGMLSSLGLEFIFTLMFLRWFSVWMFYLSSGVKVSYCFVLLSVSLDLCASLLGSYMYLQLSYTLPELIILLLCNNLLCVFLQYLTWSHINTPVLFGFYLHEIHFPSLHFWLMCVFIGETNSL
jgi:hypothetical protein